MQTPPHCPRALEAFQSFDHIDGAVRRENRDRLRELAHSHGGEVELICSHDTPTLDRCSAGG